ncbi:MAG TPA: cytochrome c3 family protein [Candidatus Paceibacterota bacterium]|nr:cytochrome c3 family protein [Verrucomicrobiota bacterium]HRY47997.1 cytochrome c3 family protein [Candidatus Paceibacterota bacterium]
MNPRPEPFEKSRPDEIRQTPGFPTKRGPRRRNFAWFPLFLVLCGWGWLATSCAHVTRTVVVPPRIPGAEYVGSEACAQCHDDITKDFKTATHARLMTPGPNALNMGCESCHGPASLHVESAGERRPPVNYRPGSPKIASGSQRQTIVNPRRSAENCYECHLDKRGQFEQPYHHPIPEGRMSCGDCHNPHKGNAVQGGGTALLAENDACLSCHSAQRGPYVFEHEAMREGCTACHDVHGSPNDKMLKIRNQGLCLKCHFQQQTGGGLYIGRVNHSGFLRAGTCWSMGCHEAVHGSHVSTSLRF